MSTRAAVVMLSLCSSDFGSLLANGLFSDYHDTLRKERFLHVWFVSNLSCLTARRPHAPNAHGSRIRTDSLPPHASRTTEAYTWW
mmetsp:Transcript_13860/g.42202  ORF Transcript_13860/g.42202 Transcript_13860/m.42202 type:complete len:85 (-) Transcript_13860:220-474(-)|eukprot:scaffold223675_cov32-Tisochrysis_lutea.AAC.3